MTPARSLACRLASYPLTFKSALERAAQDGFSGVVADALRPDFHPDDFGASARRHLLRHLRDLGTPLVQLAAEQNGAGLADPEHADTRLSGLVRVLELARGLNTPGVTTRIAGFADAQRGTFAREILGEVARAADARGVTVSVAADPSDAAALVDAIRALDCPWLRIGMDTAGVAPPEPAAVAHAGLLDLRDVKLRGERIEEVEFGSGDVDFRAWMAALVSSGFGGVLAVRRDVPGSVDALRRGREYVASLLKPGGR
ncbi:MAG: sugar phosphate isomerase/epimerase [Planctomycetia bacterium]|nr:MAG: sugar phosphate isomerase/epimerase [Planctomycetia bacterium]